MTVVLQYEGDMRGTTSLMKETLRQAEERMVQHTKSAASAGGGGTALLDDVVTYVADVTETLSAFFTACPVAAKAMAGLSADLSSLYQHAVIPAGRIYLGEIEVLQLH